MKKQPCSLDQKNSGFTEDQNESAPLNTDDAKQDLEIPSEEERVTPEIFEAIKYNSEFLGFVIGFFPRLTKNNRDKHNGHYYDQEQINSLYTYIDQICVEKQFGNNWMGQLSFHIQYCMKKDFVERYYDLFLMAGDPEKDRARRAELAKKPTKPL